MSLMIRLGNIIMYEEHSTISKENKVILNEPQRYNLNEETAYSECRRTI